MSTHPHEENGSHPMTSVTSLTDLVHARLSDALASTLPEADGVDPLLRRSDRADFQANGILALAKKAKANPGSWRRRSWRMWSPVM